MFAFAICMTKFLKLGRLKNEPTVPRACTNRENKWRVFTNLHLPLLRAVSKTLMKFRQALVETVTWMQKKCMRKVWLEVFPLGVASEVPIYIFFWGWICCANVPPPGDKKLNKKALKRNWKLGNGVSCRRQGFQRNLHRHRNHQNGGHPRNTCPD